MRRKANSIALNVIEHVMNGGMTNPKDMRFTFDHATKGIGRRLYDGPTALKIAAAWATDLLELEG